MDRYKPYILPAVAAVILAVLFIARPMLDDVAEPEAPGDAKASAGGGATSPPRHDGPSRKGPDAKNAARTPAPAEATPRALPDGARRDRARSDQLRRTLRERLAARPKPDADEGQGDAADEPSPTGRLEPDYIQGVIQDDLTPLARECYESALEDDAELAGKLVMKFTIVGEASVGGVVGEAEVDEASDISDPAMVECMRESMLSVLFDQPPSGGGEVSVTYPFEFSTEPPEREATDQEPAK